MRFRFAIGGLPLLFTCLFPGERAFADAAADSQKMWAEAGVRWGVSMIQMMGQDNQVQQPKYTSQQPASAALGQLLQSYADRKQKYNQTELGVAASAQFAVDGTAALLVGTGFGAIPAAIVHGVGTGVVDHVRQNLEKDTRVYLENYLAANRPEILQASGLSYQQLQALSPDEIRERLAQTDAFNHIQQQLPDNQQVRDFAQDLIIDGIRNVQEDTLRRVGKQGQSLAKAEADLIKVSTQFVGFQRVTMEVLSEHESQLTELKGAINEHAITHNYSLAKANPSSMSVKRAKPRHMTTLPGGGSWARAR